MANLNVCVIGAGIIGLSTAIEITDRFPSSNVTIIADKFEQETTSDGAAGHFEPSQNFKGPDSQTSEQWVTDSYTYYKNLMNREERANIKLVPGYKLSGTSEDIPQSKYMRSIACDYRQVTTEELASFNSDIKHGIYFTTLVIPCRKLLPLYTKRLICCGANFIKNKITTFNELVPEYDLIFNCTGLGAGMLCNDSLLVPVRGQITQVKTSSITKFYCYGTQTYIIPCGYNDIVTLGGSYDQGCLNSSVDDQLVASIKSRCEKIMPNLSGAPIVRNWVGFRPHRTTVRVELERIGDCKLIHNYGHGESGITLAPGTAKYAVELFRNYQRSNNGIRRSTKRLL